MTYINKYRRQRKTIDRSIEMKIIKKNNEIMKLIKKLKLGKASGEDGIENEAWRYMAKEIGKVQYIGN